MFLINVSALQIFIDLVVEVIQSALTPSANRNTWCQIGTKFTSAELNFPQSNFGHGRRQSDETDSQLSATVKTAGDVVERVDEDWARNLRRIVQSDVLEASERPSVSATGSSCIHRTSVDVGRAASWRSTRHSHHHH